MSKSNKREDAPSEEAETNKPESRDGFESTATPEPGQVELLNKIVAKEIVRKNALAYHKQTRKDANGSVLKDAAGEPLLEVANPEPRSLYRIFGVARAVRHGDSTYGQWTAFDGSFEAIRFSDHQRFQAPTVFLQGASEGLLEDALLSAQRADPSATVTFAFDIGVKVSDRWASDDKGNSYEYTVKTVFESSTHDPLKELREQAMKKLPALPPPTGK